MPKHVRKFGAAILGVSLLAIMLPTQGSAIMTDPAPQHIDCVRGGTFCTEVYDSEDVFGEGVYVGHDEPALLYYSNTPGAGNQMRYTLTLPSDPPATPLTAGKAFNFQLHPAFWFGMAMCDTQSYPLQVSTCTPDSDSNITDPAHHAGTAFTEMQFYPPGWAPWPAAVSCDATRWCAALNIDSLSQNPVTGKSLNATCTAVTGTEYVNFAFITKNGVPVAPPNPVQSTNATFTPDPTKVLFMNSGDTLQVTMHDTASGLQIDIGDQTSGQSGTMTASAANGFGQVQFAPSPSTACTNIPYDFHPMYSTSSEQTNVPWAAHSYNIAFSDEIGHFDYCNGATAITPGGACLGSNQEGSPGDQEPHDADDTACFPASSSTLVQVSGCIATNTGFDGVPYQNVWPDGNTALHPTSILFTSPLTGATYSADYDRIGFEADLPAIESACNGTTGAGCTLIPTTDDGAPAAFYPFFSKGQSQGRCVWALGNDIPGLTQDDFNKNAQYGSLLLLTYLNFGGGGTTSQSYNDFRQVLSFNPCPATTPLSLPPTQPTASPQSGPAPLPRAQPTPVPGGNPAPLPSPRPIVAPVDGNTNPAPAHR